MNEGHHKGQVARIQMAEDIFSSSDQQQQIDRKSSFSSNVSLKEAVSTTSARHHPTVLDENNQPPPLLSKNALKRLQRKQAKEERKKNKHNGTPSSQHNQKRIQTHDRHKRFVKWILQTFPHVLHNDDGDDKNKESSKQQIQQHILDVASGKGETAIRLSMCHQIPVVMVEPRAVDIQNTYISKVLPKLPMKWQRSMEKHLIQNPDFVRNKLSSKVTQLPMYFTDLNITNNQLLQEAVLNASLLLGLHADNATEAIVNAALEHNKAFVVVPCCVFGTFFPNRKLKHSGRHVNSYEDFCTYLLEKDARFRREILPFPGRNVAIWWDGHKTS